MVMEIVRIDKRSAGLSKMMRKWRLICILRSQNGGERSKNCIFQAREYPIMNPMLGNDNMDYCLHLKKFITPEVTFGRLTLALYWPYYGQENLYRQP